METKINIAAILKDKPQGTKLYDWLHNIDVELDTISTTDTETVVWCTNETNNNTTCHRGYSEFGTERGYPDGLQILFPSKEMRDWAKFSWKKGDVLANGEGDYCVFKEFAHSSYQTSKSVFVKRNKESIQSYSCLLDTKDWHKASHSCTATYINTIEKELGGKLNMETLEIEKAQPEFKDGDIVVSNSGSIVLVKEIKCGERVYYHACMINGNVYIKGTEDEYYGIVSDIDRLATDTEKLQFFEALAKKGKAWDAKKKMIVDLKPRVELKPFDRVLVRDFSRDKWSISFFSFKKEGCYVCINHCSWNQCIPYIGNESLLGTTKDVEG
ncbi:hypothetical protein [Segatella copri]|uniref:hypothetical protein n=1 Tax=Segatella copri TaxID=165179 RepID=UPI0012929857|nr:hypothetical protein [Segatella copri]MQN15074.1 hypothetical protein [Segatella copri]MQN19170.1 hypothetical protein [Segatella copri]